MAHDTDDLPEGLRREASLLAGTEPWRQLGGDVGVLLLHGLTGSPWEIMPLARRLGAGGRAIAVPLLAGHGRELADLDRSRWQDWLLSSRQAMRWLEPHCERVHLVGLSMGALLALLLASQRSGLRVASLTLLAPALTLGSAVELGLRGVGALGWPRSLGKNSVVSPSLAVPGHHEMPVAPLLSLLDLQDVIHSLVVRPSCPMLMLQGTADRTIPPRAAARQARRLFGPSLRLEWIRGGGHLLPRGEQVEEVLIRVERFIEEVDLQARSV